MVKIQDIIIWILVIITAIVVFWYIFGNSPTMEQAILFLMLTMSITTLVKLSVLETKFKFLIRDFKEHVKHKQK